MDAKQELVQRWGALLCHYLENEKEVLLQRADYWSPPVVEAFASFRLVSFGVILHKVEDLTAVLRCADEVAMYLDARACRAFRHYGQVVFELPLPQQLVTSLAADQLRLAQGLSVHLGYTPRMTPVSFRIDGPNIAPILLAGKTGAGKTEALRTILWVLFQQNTPEQMQVVVYDPKSKFKMLENSAHLALPVLHDYRDCVVAMGWLLGQLHEREKLGPEEAAAMPRLIFAVDELIDLMVPDVEKLVVDGLGTLARLGREFGIHMILGTQRPDRKYMDRLSAANIGLRLVGRVSDTTEATAACGTGGTHAEDLEGGGDMLAILGGSITRMQVAMVAEGGWDQLLCADTPPVMPQQQRQLMQYLKGGGGQITQVPAMAPFVPTEIAHSLTDVGIRRLMQRCHMGQDRATVLRKDWGLEILEALKGLGYKVVRQEDKDEETTEAA